MHPRTMAAMAGLAALCGCASTVQLPPIRDGSAVAIAVSMSAQARGTKAIENKALGHDTSVGAASGAVAFGLWGLSCGPFAIVCIPAAAGFGALTGGVAGAGVGWTGALTNEKATLLRDRIERSEQANPPLEALRRHVEERARQHWRVAEADASASMTLELQDLELTSSRDEQIGFVVRVRVSTRLGSAGATVSQKMYEYVGPTSNLAVWLDERNEFFDTSIRLAMQQLAAQIVSELARG